MIITAFIYIGVGAICLAAIYHAFMGFEDIQEELAKTIYEEMQEARDMVARRAAWENSGSPRPFYHLPRQRIDLEPNELSLAKYDRESK